MKKLIFLFSIILFCGCSEQEQVFIHNEEISNTKIKCMKLTVFPPNNEITNTLKKLYEFKKDCEYNLVISYKNSITCNSNQNSDNKVIGIPTSYLRMEIKKDNHLQYTYYKDLKENLNSKDVENGFEVIKDDLNFQLHLQ